MPVSLAITLASSASATTPVSLPAAGSLGSAIAGQTYSAYINALGGDRSNYQWTVNGNTIPWSGTPVAIADGITAWNTGGYTLSIGGKPTSAGTVTLKVSVLDVAPNQSAGPVSYTIAVANPSYTVSGHIYLQNGCGNNGNLPAIKVSINTSPAKTTTTDSNGNFSFQSIPNGSYTITPSISGPTSVFSPASQKITVNNNNFDGVNFNATLIYTITGKVSYSGSKTGRIYITLNSNNCGGSYTPGTSIAAPGTFTIRGVTPGSYTVQAWMDNLGYGAPNASNPSGSISNVSIPSNGSGTVTLTDPAAVTLPSTPGIQGVSPFDQGVFIPYNPITNNNGVELATSYLVQWSSTKSFTKIAGSKTFPATGTNGSSVWMINGLSTTGLAEGGTYYFRAQGKVGSSSSPLSAVTGPVTIGPPTGANTLSGTITWTGTATGPLYVGVYNGNTSTIYATAIQKPVSPQKYTVQVPNGSNYAIFGIIDQNNDGLIDAGDIQNTNGNNGPPAIIVSGATTGNLTLPSSSSIVTLATSHNRQTGTSDSYNLSFDVVEGTKLPVAVTVVSGPHVYTTDIGRCNDCGGYEFDVNLNSTAPKVGDAYSLQITYKDGTTETKTATVGTVLSAFATNMLPNTTGASARPNFSWTDPASAGSYLYGFKLWDSNGNTIWRIPADHSNSNGFSSAITSIKWGVDPTGSGNKPSVPILSSDSTYGWQITTKDANGDKATTQVSFQTAGTPASLPTTDPSSLPATTVVNQSYFGSISVIGGVAPYNWQVNWNTSNDNLNWYTTTDGSSLVISGTPSQTGTVTFQAYLTDSTGASSGWQTYTITVNPYATGYWPVYGQISFNGCGTDESPVTLTLSGNGITQTAVSDSTGMYQFPSVPNGTYTITPSITGPTSVFSPASRSLTVKSSYVNNNNFNAYLGYTVTGQAGYEGANTGVIYLALNGCGNTTPGTSISASGAFTIHGVPPGVYTLQAWMDNKSEVAGKQLGGYGVQNASNPTGGVSNVLVPNVNDANLTIGLYDPSPVALTSAPTWTGQASGAFSGGAFVSYTPIRNSSNVEIPSSYTLEYSTDAAFKTGVLSKSFPATGGKNAGFAGSMGVAGLQGGNSPWVVTGLTNGSKYYFRAAGVVGSGTSAVTGPWSAASSGIVIGAPTGGNALSGTVIFSGKATGPLYVGYWNQNTSGIYAEEIASPVSPQAYSVSVPTGSNYFFFAFIDQNNDGEIDPGDITNTFNYNMVTPPVKVAGTLANQNLTLSSANSSTVIITGHNDGAGYSGTSATESYELDLVVSVQNKLPVSVELLSGANVLAPMDIAVCPSCGYNPNSRFWGYLIQLNSAVAPTVGSTYGVKVIYSDGTSETLSPKVTAVLPETLALDHSPIGPVTAANASTLKPTFNWKYPASPGNYLYQLWVADERNYTTAWSIPNVYSATNAFKSSVSSITWGTDPTDSTNLPAISSLVGGDTYEWEFVAYDANGNRSNANGSYTPGYKALALPAANPSSLGSAIVGQPYSGSIAPTGGYLTYGGGYTYSVNSANDWGWTSIPLGNGLTADGGWGLAAMTISGTPTTTGKVSFTVYAQDASGITVGPVKYTINVTEPPVTLPAASSNPLGSALVGVSYAGTINASGGAGGYSFTVNGIHVPAIEHTGAVPTTWTSLGSSGGGLSVANSGGNTLWFSGTPTKVGSISLAVTVKDSSNSSSTASVTYTLPVVAQPNGANNKLLKGTYVCKEDGFNDSDGSRWTSLGSFQANGAAGTITSGKWDMNGRSFTSEMSGTQTGAYSIGPDNNGLMTLNSIETSGGSGTHSSQLALALNNTGSATTATEFRVALIDSQDEGMHGSGVCYQANTSVFGTDVFTGKSFVFKLDGEDGGGNPKAGLGRFVTSGGSITGGVIDEAKITNSSATESALTGGSYTVPDATNGRSTLTFTASGTNGGTGTFEIYVIDANRMFMILTSETKAQSADVRKQQQAKYSGTNLDGPLVLYTQSYDGSGYDSEIMQGTGNGVVSTGTGNLTINQSYKDESGTYKVGNDIGGPVHVTFDSTNPGRTTISGGNNESTFLYFFDNNSAFMMDFSTNNDAYLETGWLEPQTQTTFTDTALAGSYLFGGMAPLVSDKNESVGEVSVSSSGAITGKITSAGPGDFAFDQSQSIGSLTWLSTTDGIFSVPGEKGNISVCAVISSAKIICLDSNSSSASMEILEK
jgi:hypothetical protein